MVDRKTPKQDKAWGGRFRKAADPVLESFSSSVHFDRNLLEQDVRGSIAHARMLAKQGVLAEAEACALIGGLEQVAEEFASGRFVPDPSAEDIHMNVERRLYAILGPVAGKLHSGRSRNDQVATDFVLWMRDHIPEVRSALAELRGVLVDRAEKEIDVVLPGYTHLQRAQPVRLAHHWLAYFEMLSRDDTRLADTRNRMNASPLGAGALAGSTLPLDRQATATELGFDAPTANSMDAIASRDGALELLSSLSILMIHLSRMCEELVMWSSSEFGFVEMDDAFATGSSLMPQKKNPDGAELVRGKSGRVVGSLVSLLMTVKGLPLTYNRDLQEDKEPVFDAVDTATQSLRMLAAMLSTLRVNRSAMQAAAADPLLYATDLAEHLVDAGVPFREAHELVGRIVADAGESQTLLSELSREALQGYHPALDLDPAAFFSADRSLDARTLVGGPARANLEVAVRDARQRLQSEGQEPAE